MAKKVTAIVLAAGKGSRMNSDIPKQYLSLLGKPVLFYSLLAFEKSNADEIILVTGSGEQEYCQKEIIEKYHLNKVVHIVEGGAERYHSVHRGLLAAMESDYVLIHDGARPLISTAVINAAIDKVKENGACVVGMPVKDTIQIVDEECMICSTPERKYTWLAQTPQVFKTNLYRAAAYACRDEDFTATDDNQMAEHLHIPVKLVSCSRENIKITEPSDLIYAQAVLTARAKAAKNSAEEKS